MAFVRVRTINGKQYRYLEERWREGGKVRSKSTYLGSVIASIFRPIPPEDRGLRYIARLMEKYPAPEVVRSAPIAPVTPIEKAPSTVDLSAPVPSPDAPDQSSEQASDGAPSSSE